MEEVQSTQQPTTEPVGFPGAPIASPSNQKKNWKWLVILILFLLVIGGVTFFVFKSSKNVSTTESTPTPQALSDLIGSATPEATPTSTPSDKTQVKISVLNGTGIAGAAGLLSDALKSLGYTNVTTGNASSQNATSTEVIFASTVSQDVVTEITKKLNDLYTSVTTGNTTLPSGTDIQITTGLKKGETSAPTGTPTPDTSSSPTPTASASATTTP